MRAVIFLIIGALILAGKVDDEGGKDRRSLAAGLAVLGAGLRASETTVYTYDALGRMIGSSTTGSVNDGLQVGTAYDAAGNRTQYTVQGASNLAVLSIAAASAVEGRPLNFTVTRAGNTSSSVTVTYTSASGTAAQGIDFIGASDTVTFAPGDTQKTVTVLTTDDDVAAEGAETMTVALAVVTGMPAIIVPVSYQASSNWGNYTGLSGNGAGMRDNGYDTPSSVHGTQGIAGSKVTMDLGSAKSIGNVVLAPIAVSYSDWGPYYLNGATLERSDDGVAWTPVLTIAGAKDREQTEHPVNATARYLQIRHTTGTFLGVGEFAARGPGAVGGVTLGVASAVGTITDNDSGEPTPILAATYRTTSTYGGYTGLLDNGQGMRDGFFTGSANVHGTQGIIGSWVELDLGSSKSVGKVVIAPITASWDGWNAAYLNGATLEYSDNGSSWTFVQIITAAADGQAAEYNINTTTRYIRIHRPTGSWLGVGDFFAQTP